MNVRFIVFDENKIEPFQKQLIQEYEKRLSRYCKTKLLVVKKEKDLLKQYREGNYAISILPGKSKVTSVDLANKLNEWGISGQANLDFYFIPTHKGDLGIEFQEELVISNMEFQPMIATGLLYEQIYRAYRILNKEPYHK